MNSNEIRAPTIAWSRAKTWLITGGAGFIGSHVTEALLEHNDLVVVVDDFSTGRRENLPNHPNLTLIEKNLLDLIPNDLPEPISGILHLAALPSVTESWNKPLHAHRLNLTSTLHMLELARHLKIPRFVFASSAAVYGAQEHLPIREDAPLAPQSPYGLQKSMSEQYLALYAREIGLAALAMRFFNVYGPRQRSDSFYSGVISIFTELMRQGLPVTVYGDGHQTRDFIYVKDVAAGLQAALAVRFQPSKFMTLNLGTGQSQSVQVLIDTLKPLFPSWPGKIQYRPARAGEIRHSRADCRRALESLNFKPQWTLSAGLEALVKT